MQRRRTRTSRQSVPPILPTGSYKLEVAHVAKSFPQEAGTLNVLEDVSLHLTAGEFVTIIGPSGCGKSTLFNIVAGLETPDRGMIFVDGHPALGRREACAYMPQKDLLFPWRRILDNTTLGLEIQGIPKKAARTRAVPLFPAFGLAGFENQYPFQLSGGMRQRAALLRTVVQERDILLLDEPFGALDSLTRTDMQVWLADMWEKFGWTVLLVTHDIPEAVFLSERVYVMSGNTGCMQEAIHVDLPRPRTLELRASSEFALLEGRLFGSLQKTRRSATNGAGEVGLAGRGSFSGKSRMGRRRS